MKRKCIMMVNWPTVPIWKPRTSNPPVRDVTYGGQETGAVPRSDFMDRATPTATSASPIVPVRYLAINDSVLFFISLSIVYAPFSGRKMTNIVKKC